jgi:hypothetical protein
MATDDPMRASGLQADTVQQGAETGAVNVLSGNLTLSIPVGPTYPVNEGLSYGLSLSYSSNLRRWVTRPLPEPGNQYPRGRSTVGYGWVMHFGRIAPNPERRGTEGEPEFAYQDPSGAWYPLRRTLDVAACGVLAGTCYLTRDGTFIRAERASDGSSWRLWTPDGVERVLGHRVGAGWACSHGEPQPTCEQDDDFEGWYTTRILDPSGTDSVTIVYDAGKPRPAMKKVWDSVRGESKPTLEFVNDAEGQTEIVHALVDDQTRAWGLVRAGAQPPESVCPILGNPMGSTVVDVELLTELWTPDGKMTGFSYDPGAAQALGRMDRPGGLAAVEYDWGCIPYRAATKGWLFWHFRASARTQNGWVDLGGPGFLRPARAPAIQGSHKEYNSAPIVGV